MCHSKSAKSFTHPAVSSAPPAFSARQAFADAAAAVPGALALEAECAAADVRLAEESKDVPPGLVVAEAALPDGNSALVDSAADDSVAADCSERGDSAVRDLHPDARSSPADCQAGLPGCCQVVQR